jgi:hypothetical protein
MPLVVQSRGQEHLLFKTLAPVIERGVSLRHNFGIGQEDNASSPRPAMRRIDVPLRILV